MTADEKIAVLDNAVSKLAALCKAQAGEAIQLRGVVQAIIKNLSQEQRSAVIRDMAAQEQSLLERLESQNPGYAAWVDSRTPEEIEEDLK